jgi:hypothetical protein
MDLHSQCWVKTPHRPQVSGFEAERTLAWVHINPLE